VKRIVACPYASPPKMRDGSILLDQSPLRRDQISMTPSSRRLLPAKSYRVGQL
jgi:hypothetical protein